MNINILERLNFYSNYFFEKTLSKVSKKQVVITLIAFAALSCIAYSLVCSRKNRVEIKKKESKPDLSTKDETRYFDSDPDFSTEDGIRYFDPDNAQYDILSKDLEDKVWQHNKNDYEKEISNIKSLKEKFNQQKGEFEKCLMQEYPLFYQPTYSKAVSGVLYKALKIRDLYRTTHYTFLHSRMLDWKIFSYFTKKLVKSFRPDLKLNLIEFLRAPFKTHCAQNVSDFINKYNEKEGSCILDSETFFRGQLISVDAFWLSQAPLESAMSFFLSNSNLSYGIHHACKPVILTCLNQNNSKHKALIDSSVKKIKNIINNFKEEIRKQYYSIPGELVVICVPKAMVQDPATNPSYRCMGLGIPHPNGDEAVQNISLLEELQQDKIPKNSEDIEMFTPGSNIQYRLLASLLTPKNGVRIFGVDALSKDLREHYKQPIKALVDEIFAASK